MKFTLNDFTNAAQKIRSSDIYDVHDLKFLKNLIVSMTILHTGKETSGHSHKNEEEVYLFLEGSGKMQLGKEKFNVKKRDVVLIPGGKFHKVYNTNKGDLKFFCVFEKYDKR